METKITSIIIHLTDAEKEAIRKCKKENIKPDYTPILSPKIDTKIKVNQIKRDVALSLASLIKRINDMPVNEQMAFCQKEKDKLRDKIFLLKMNGNNPEMLKDCKRSFKFLKHKVGLLQNKSFPGETIINSKTHTHDHNLTNHQTPIEKNKNISPTIETKSLKEIFTNLSEKNNRKLLKHLKAKYSNKPSFETAKLLRALFYLGYIPESFFSNIAGVHRTIIKELDFSDSYTGFRTAYAKSKVTKTNPVTKQYEDNYKDQIDQILREINNHIKPGFK